MFHIQKNLHNNSFLPLPPCLLTTWTHSFVPPTHHPTRSQMDARTTGKQILMTCHKSQVTTNSWVRQQLWDKMGQHQTKGGHCICRVACHKFSCILSHLLEAKKGALVLEGVLHSSCPIACVSVSFNVTCCLNILLWLGESSQ